MDPLSTWIKELPQIVPQSWCLSCRICCRFPEREGVQTPTWSKLEAGWLGDKQAGGWLQPSSDGSPSLLPVLQPCGEGHRCPAFQPGSNRCSIYDRRPLDCRLYPFVLAHDPGRQKVVLAMDAKCPYIETHGDSAELAGFSRRLARILESPEGQAYLRQNPKLVGPFFPEFVSVAALAGPTEFLQQRRGPPHPKLRPLDLQHCDLVQEALRGRRHAASAYTLAGILGWMDVWPIWWTRLAGALCLFVGRPGELFMPLPPLGGEDREWSFAQAWEMLCEINQGSGVSRIEGVERWQARQLERQGWGLCRGEAEAFYRRGDLIGLRGDRYRSQRWAINRLKRALTYSVRPYQDEDLEGCLELLAGWVSRRSLRSQDSYPKALIRDALFFHRRLMISHQSLGLTGWVLEAQGRLRGYTFAAPVSPSCWVVFLEITDRSLPGLGAALFQVLCQDLPPHVRYVNGMGDSGLESLRRTKEAYRPVGWLATFVARDR